ncbi:predicted protein [Postia placenta Mad-698-R]|nr:predicted protein [Postia placenta Mad-698-R]
MRSQALISEVVFNVNSIVAALFTRGRDEGFHWMLALPGAGEEPGADLKLHVNNPRGRWQFQAGDHNLPQSETLCTVIRIGSRGMTTPAQIRRIVEGIGMNVVPEVDRRREERFTCRVWFREAIRRLVENNILHCLDVDALEAELISLSSPSAEGVLAGTGKYTIHIAASCF